jgi:hypothetical protein
MATDNFVAVPISFGDVSNRRDYEEVLIIRYPSYHHGELTKGLCCTVAFGKILHGFNGLDSL